MAEGAAERLPSRFVPFGKYLLLEQIAVGGMAEVYLSKAFANGTASELLAVKRILPALAKDEEFIRMFLDEATIAGQLNHPNIVKIRELGRIGASHYLAMDFVWGKDLLAIARRCRLLGARLSPAFVAWLAAHICEALHYAHIRQDKEGKPLNIIHRDVSPQNVLLSFDGKVKVIDFGIAKAQNRSTHTQAGVLKGKVGYMSPEQVKGRDIDHRSDLFAVGTCMYELLTLKSLFARPNNFESMENVRNVRAKPIREARGDVPPPLADIIERALQAEPEDRWESAEALQNKLREFVAGHEPDFERVKAVGWLRDIFRKDFRRERVRLEAFDQIGEPQVVPADGTRRSSITELEIPAVAPPVPDWDEDESETEVAGEVPQAVLDAAQDAAGQTEVFFSSAEMEAEPAPASSNADSSGASAPSSGARPVFPTTNPSALAPPGFGGRPPASTAGPSSSPVPATPASATPAVAAPSPSTAPPPAPARPPLSSPSSLSAAPASMPPQPASMSPQPASMPPQPASMPPQPALPPAPGSGFPSGPPVSGYPPGAQPAPGYRPQGFTSPIDQTARVTTQSPSISGRTKLIMGIMAVLMLIMIAGSVGAFLFGSMSAKSTVEVRTQPSANAIVYLDGTRVGTAPIRLENVRPGAHTVTVVAPGYPEQQRPIDVPENALVVVDIVLRPGGSG